MLLILEYLGEISLSEKSKSEDALCNQCYTLVEKFDYFQDQSRIAQVRLTEMLKRAQPEKVYIKQEPEESISNACVSSNSDKSEDEDDWTETHKPKRRR